MLIQTSFILISMFDYLYTWAIGLLRSLGLANKRAKLLLLGLDCAGKSTLLGRLATGHLHACTPTQRATSEQLELGGITFTCHDVGGHEAAREVWADYYVDVDAVVFVVDAADAARFGEAKVELDALLSNYAMRATPIAVLGNKIDLPLAASEVALRAALGLGRTCGRDVTRAHGVQPVEVFMCSIVNNAGYAEAFRWVANYLQ